MTIGESIAQAMSVPVKELKENIEYCIRTVSKSAKFYVIGSQIKKTRRSK